MKYAIITPTYKGHFKYIKEYLKSFDKYVLDKKDIEIIFTISRIEKNDFEKIIKNYKETLNIRVLLFEDILKTFNINLTTNELLQKYQKFSFQTLKKFYTMLYSDADYFLVLDSESMWIKDTNMKNMFCNFFENPFIAATNTNTTEKISDFKQSVINNINYSLKKDCNKWFLENFIWFYDKKILIDLINEIGTPIEIVDNILKNQDERNHEAGIFEIELYQAYIYHNREKYNYNFIDINYELEKYLNRFNLEKYVACHSNNLKGDFGLVEQTLILLTEENVNDLAKMFKNNKFNIIRCEKTTLENLVLQQKFVNIVEPNILAASLEHSFGLKKPFVELVIKNNAYRKIIKHIQRLCSKKDVFEIIPILYFIFLFPFNYFINCYKYRRLYVK